jgi:hypothetical protein
MEGRKVNTPRSDKTSMNAKVVKLDQKTIKPTPTVKRETPRSIPVRRPLVSATVPSSGPNTPEAERRVTTRESFSISTPILRPINGKNGYTIRIAVFITVRMTTKTGICNRSELFFFNSPIFMNFDFVP